MGGAASDAPSWLFFRGWLVYGDVLLRLRTCRQRPHRDRDLPGDQRPWRLQLQPRRIHAVRVLGRRREWRAARRLRQSPRQARFQAALCTNLVRLRHNVAGVVPSVGTTSQASFLYSVDKVLVQWALVLVYTTV